MHFTADANATRYDDCGVLKVFKASLISPQLLPSPRRERLRNSLLVTVASVLEARGAAQLLSQITGTHLPPRHPRPPRILCNHRRPKTWKRGNYIQPTTSGVSPIPIVAVLSPVVVILAAIVTYFSLSATLRFRRLGSNARCLSESRQTDLLLPPHHGYNADVRMSMSSV